MAEVSQITNLTELRSAIGAELDRTDLATTIALWPQLCEAEVSRKLRHFKMLTEVEIPGYGSNRVPLPSDWEESRNVRVDGRQVTYQLPDVLDMERTKVLNGATDPLYPRFYTHFGNYVEIWPYPDEEYTVTLQYYQSIPPLATQTGQTNWLLQRSPAAYFYGSLIHSAPFLHDDARIALWSKLFNDTLAELQGASDRAQHSGSRLTRRPPISFG